jgi:hypothetical protein
VTSVVVLQVVKGCLEAGDVTAQQIGVITPYRGQQRQITKVLMVGQSTSVGCESTSVGCESTSVVGITTSMAGVYMSVGGESMSVCAHKSANAGISKGFRLWAVNR